MFDLSKRREKRLKFLGRASAGVLALALVGSAFLFQEASTAKRETEKAKNEAARAQVDAEKLESQANNFRKNAQESRRDARIALKEANRLKREARDDKRKAELATRASIQARASAEQATERAQLADSASKRSQQTVTIAKRALASSTLKQIESYNRDGQGDEDPASREGYDRLVSALAALGPKYSYSVEERGKIADVHLNALNHAVSQLDPAFLMDAIRNAEIVLANPAIEGDELRQRRLKLGKARLLLWDGSAENVIAASKLYAEVSDAAGPQPADPENQRLKMIAETGRAEIALQANVQNPPAPQCFDVRDTDDASSVVRSEIIRRVVARTRCLQMQGRLKSVQADAISSFDDTSTWLSRLPTLIRQDTRIKREEANTFLIYGDTLTKLLTPEQTVIRARSRQAQQAYFKAISPLRNGPDRIITLAATTDFPSGDLPDSPADTPFHRYALIDVQNMVRSRIRNAQSIATWTLADATEPDVGMAQVDWTRSRGRLAPAARAASYLVSQANRQQSVGDPPDIHDYRKNLRSLLSDGAGIAVKLYGRREGRSGEEPHYGFDNMADTIAVSLSFARDALLLKVSPKSEGGAVIVPRTPPLRTARVQPPRADTSKPAAKKKFLFGLLGGTRKVENQQFPDAPTPERPAIPEGLEDVYKSINALGSIIGNLDDERGFQTNFLDYIPDESATSLPPISDARKLDRLEGIASEICAFDSDLASLCSSVENLKGKIDATRNRYSLKTVNSDDVWTDRRGIALGGIDVVACFDDVAKEESATNFDDEEEDSFVAFLRTKKGVKGLPIPPEKNSKRVPRSQTCELKYGNLAFSEERSGVIWLFESAGNRNKFRAAGSITKYLPFAKGFELTSYLDGKSDEYEFYRKEQGREFNVSGRIFNGRLYLKAFDAGEE